MNTSKSSFIYDIYNVHKDLVHSNETLYIDLNQIYQSDLQELLKYNKLYI